MFRLPFQSPIFPQSFRISLPNLSASLSLDRTQSMTTVTLPRRWKRLSWGLREILPRSVLRLFYFFLPLLRTTCLFDLLNILPPQNFFRWQWWQIWSVLLSTPMAGMKQDHRQLSYKRRTFWNLEWRRQYMFSQWWYDFLFFWHLLSYVGAAMFPRWTHYNLALSQTILSQKAHTHNVALLRPCSSLPFSSPHRRILIFPVLFIYLPMKRLNTKNLAVYPSYLPSCSDEGAWWSYRSRGFGRCCSTNKIKKKIPKDSPSIGRGC